jgi:hypothetical protein
VAGEDTHDVGREGLLRAKQWLDLTSRVKQSCTHADRPMSELLHFRWPYGAKRQFSFDLGGNFRGDDLDGQSFLAEIKNYRCENDLPTHFRDFLAKCYVALESKPDRCDHFLWISWSPFQARRWDKHATSNSVRNSVVHSANRKRVLGVDSETDAVAKLNADLTVQVADRIWLVTLSSKQEQLVLTESYFREMARILEGGFRV